MKFRNNKYNWKEISISQMYKLIKQKNVLPAGIHLGVGKKPDIYTAAIKEINEERSELYCCSINKAKREDEKTLTKYSRYLNRETFPQVFKSSMGEIDRHVRRIFKSLIAEREK